MTEAQKQAAKLRNETICPTCDGKGRILSESARTRSRQGGNAGYRASLKPGARAMGDRGQGTTRMPTIEDLRRGEAKRRPAGADVPPGSPD